MADFGATELEAFRSEARAWLEANFPAKLKTDPAAPGGRHDGRPGRAPRRSSGASGWATRAGARRPGRRQYGGGGLSRGRGAGAAAGDGRDRRPQPDRRHGRDDVRPDPARVRHRGAEAAPHPADRHAARCAGARAIPSPAPAPTSPRLQTKCEDKGDHWLINGQKIWTSRRQLRRLVLLPGAHRPDQEARGHQLRADRHEDAGRRDAADQADHRRIARSARPSSPT